MHMTITLLVRLCVINNDEDDGSGGGAGGNNGVDNNYKQIPAIKAK